ncbi:triple tyrosine motif-containing protein [Fredinandcohnia salidurans]|uniref:Triple tyrosine motif-containing protein n=1 Tax=Fredinandcohnia salidurans TaxID=2595041 RepID=A0ABW4MQD7_9BACI
MLAQNQEDLEYRFLIFKGTHLIKSQSYSNLNNITWNPTEPGSYKIKVQIKHRLSSNQFDDAHEIPYIVFRSIPLDAVLPSSVRIKKTGTIMIKKIL